MKKILLTILISTISLASFAGIFNSTIPQPDFISNDWDNDGDPNSTDPDDDNDGVLDDDDSIPFGENGRNSTPNVILNSFTSNKISYFPNEDITLSWSIDNIRSLNIFDDSLLTSHVAEVTNKTSIITSPIGDTTYYLDFETGVSSTQVFEYKVDTTLCTDWSPDASTIDSGTTFSQNRNCTISYISEEPNTTTSFYSETNNGAVGTKPVGVCTSSNYSMGEIYGTKAGFLPNFTTWKNKSSTHTLWWNGSIVGSFYMYQAQSKLSSSNPYIGSDGHGYYMGVYYGSIGNGTEMGTYWKICRL